jgi:hypothetical protein
MQEDRRVACPPAPLRRRRPGCLNCPGTGKVRSHRTCRFFRRKCLSTPWGSDAIPPVTGKGARDEVSLQGGTTPCPESRRRPRASRLAAPKRTRRAASTRSRARRSPCGPTRIGASAAGRTGQTSRTGWTRPAGLAGRGAGAARRGDAGHVGQLDAPLRRTLETLYSAPAFRGGGFCFP